MVGPAVEATNSLQAIDELGLDLGDSPFELDLLRSSVGQIVELTSDYFLELRQLASGRGRGRNTEPAIDLT